MNKTLIETLQQKLWDGLAAAVPDRTSRYAILDFPNHSNIGDSAIYIGEDILLRRYFDREASIVTEAFERDIEDVAQIIDRIDVIFLHGGGNFGDLWPRHQVFREAVIDRFRTKKIVQLPQTLFFSTEAPLRKSADVINRHADFTLMVRDHKSLEVATGAFQCAISLTPDMAFMIGPTNPSRRPDLKVLGLMREDQEGKFDDVSSLRRLPNRNLIVDWPAESKKRTIWSRAKARLRRGSSKKRKTPKAYRQLALRRLQTGFDLLSRGEIVVTDRLHAHILSVLLGKPHVVLDNSYGKISTFIEAWTEGGSFSLAAGINEAAICTSQMAARGQSDGAGSHGSRAPLIAAAIIGGAVAAYAAVKATRYDATKESDI